MNVAAHNDKMLKNTEQTSNKMKKKEWERLLLTFSSPKLKHCLKEGNGSAHFRTDGSLLQTHTPTHTLVSPCSSFITLCVCVCVSVVFPPDVRGHNRRHTVRLSRTDVPHRPRKPPPQVGSTCGRLRHSRRLLMEAQILSAGPSLMFMVEMRWSSRSSRSACPSISCDRN